MNHETDNFSLSYETALQTHVKKPHRSHYPGFSSITRANTARAHEKQTNRRKTPQHLKNFFSDVLTRLENRIIEIPVEMQTHSIEFILSQLSEVPSNFRESVVNTRLPPSTTQAFSGPLDALRYTMPGLVDFKMHYVYASDRQMNKFPVYCAQCPVSVHRDA